jgi:hypothetical protein
MTVVDGSMIAMYISLDSEKSNVNVNGYYHSTETVASCMKKLYAIIATQHRAIIFRNFTFINEINISEKSV